MGRTRRKGQYSKSKSHSSVQNSNKETDLTELLALAEFHLSSCELKLAKKYTKKALKLNSNSSDALELHGIVLLEADDPNGAMKYLKRAVELYPNEGHTKYLYLGDLQNGIDAINCFKKAIQLMEANMSILKQQPVCVDAANFLPQISGQDENSLKNEISMSYCSIAQIYLTDSYIEEKVVNEECLLACQRALDFNEKSGEAYQIMASYFISVDNLESARQCAFKSMEYLCIPLPDNDVAESEEQTIDMKLIDDENIDISDDVISKPIEAGEAENLYKLIEEGMDPESFFIMLNLAKVLIELNELTTAVDILDSLLEMEDEVIEVWYLLGWIYYIIDEREEALTSLEHASKLSNYLECDDEEILRHIGELIKDLHTQQANNVPQQESEQTEGSTLEMET